MLNFVIVLGCCLVYLVRIGFTGFLPSLTVVYLFLLSFTRFLAKNDLVLPSLPSFTWFLPSFTGVYLFYRALLDF